jgi:hypothetical protein
MLHEVDALLSIYWAVGFFYLDDFNGRNCTNWLVLVANIA